MDFTGKLVLIGGGSSGIGLATACQLAAKGANIWIMARTPEKLAKAEAEISRFMPIYRPTDGGSRR